MVKGEKLGGTGEETMGAVIRNFVRVMLEKVVVHLQGWNTCL